MPTHAQAIIDSVASRGCGLDVVDGALVLDPDWMLTPRDRKAIHLHREDIATIVLQDPERMAGFTQVRRGVWLTNEYLREQRRR